MPFASDGTRRRFLRLRVRELPQVYFERLLETSPDIVVAVDREGIVIFYNDGAAATLGYSAIPTLFDFNNSHATNPSWTGHARYHVVWQVVSFDIMAILSLWLIWTAAAACQASVVVLRLPFGNLP